MAKPKRDNTYYLGVVEKKHPAIYARYLAGEFKSAAAAILAAGVRQPPKQIHALKRAWKNATATERAEFLSIVGLRTSGAASTPLPSHSLPPITDVEGRLTSDGKHWIIEIMTKRRLTMGLVMEELGQKRLNASVGRAMNQGHRLKSDLAASLQAWVDRHRGL